MSVKEITRQYSGTRIILKASWYFRGTQYRRNHARNPVATASAIKCRYVLQSSTRTTRRAERPCACESRRQNFRRNFRSPASRESWTAASDENLLSARNRIRYRDDIKPRDRRNDVGIIQSYANSQKGNEKKVQAKYRKNKKKAKINKKEKENFISLNRKL